MNVLIDRDSDECENKQCAHNVIDWGMHADGCACYACSGYSILWALADMRNRLGEQIMGTTTMRDQCYQQVISAIDYALGGSNHA